MEAASPVLRWETEMEFFDFFWQFGAGLADVVDAAISWLERTVGLLQKAGAELSPGG